MRRSVDPTEPKMPRAAEDGIYNEPCANHGDDSGLPFRQETVGRFTALNNEIRRLYKNPVLTPNEKVLSAEAKAKKLIATLEHDIETQWHLISRKRADLSERAAAALRAPRDEWRAAASEVRSVLRAMSPDQRATFLQSLSGDDERMVQYAVASVPPEMTGVALEAHKRMRDVLLALHDPRLLSEPKDLEDRARHLKTLEQNVPLMARELVDFDRAAALRSLTEG